jgi:predicted hexulose-6-phosphate isomerase
MKTYTLGLYEKALPADMDFDAMLYHTKKAGFDRLEISIDETDMRLARLEWSVSELDTFTRTVAASGISVDTMCLSGHRRFPLGSHSETTRARALDIMNKAVLFCHRTGIRIIQLAGYDVYYEECDDYTRQMFAENLQRSVEMAASFGILLGFETMETAFMDTVEKSMAYILAIDSPYLGIYPDIGNLKNAALLYGGDVCTDIRSGTGHLLAAHLKETLPGVYRDMRFGTGHTEYVPCIRALWESGVRMFTGEFWYLDAENWRSDIDESSSFLRRKIESAIADTKDSR